MVCSKCGHELKKDALFCGHCGMKIEESNENVVIQKKEEAISSLVPNSVIISLVFGVLLFSIFMIFLISLFSHNVDVLV